MCVPKVLAPVAGITNLLASGWGCMMEWTGLGAGVNILLCWWEGSLVSERKGAAAVAADVVAVADEDAAAFVAFALCEAIRFASAVRATSLVQRTSIRFRSSVLLQAESRLK